MPTGRGYENERARAHDSGERAATFREILEALTALGFYIETAYRDLEHLPEQEVVRRLSAVLRKGLTQHERASEAIRRLRDIDTPDRAPPAPEGFV